MHGEFRLCRLEDGERGCGATEVKQATTAGQDRLVVAGAEAEKVAKLVMAAAEALGGGEALEPAHTSCAPFDAPVILLQSVVPVRAGPVHDPPAERRADRPRVGAVTVRGDAVGAMPVTACAERKKAWAAAMSRCSLSMVSTRLPSRSMAR